MATRQFFGTDGIRGPANVPPLTPDFAVALGRAAAQVLGDGSEDGRLCVVVGRDTRLSGPMLESALAAGLNSAGADVELLGVLPTPGVAQACRQRGADFAAVISASHNHAADNGIKFFAGDGFKLPDATELAIEEALGGEARLVKGDAVGTIRTIPDARELYLKAALASVPGLDLSGFKIVIDAANGAAVGVTSEALRRLGAEVVEIAAEPDGTNINDGCGSTHPALITAAVVENAAHLGFAHDGDADRVLAVDETGSALDGDEFLAIAARHLLAQGRLAGNTLVATVMSTFGLDACLREGGGTVVRTDVGDRYVIEAMREGGFNLGGEQSGHFIFADHATTGDGLGSALQLLAILGETGRPLSELRRCLRKTPQLLRAIPVAAKPPLEGLPALQEAIRETESALGDSGRVLLRYSGTGPNLRILLEGEDAAELEDLCKTLEEVVAREIG